MAFGPLNEVQSLSFIWLKLFHYPNAHSTSRYLMKRKTATVTAIVENTQHTFNSDKPTLMALDMLSITEASIIVLIIKRSMTTHLQIPICIYVATKMTHKIRKGK